MAAQSPLPCEESMGHTQKKCTKGALLWWAGAAFDPKNSH